MATISHETTYIRGIQIRTGEFGKRLFDIVISAMGLMILSPAFAVVALYIKRTSPGPVFYRGPRVGRGGKIFDILKFSTMRDCPESEDSPRITARDDPRITPGGRWLRDTKLNEFPQLWNVLKGEMSLVGPRPEEMRIAALYSAWHRQRLAVKPGITGPMQTYGRGTLSLDERVRLELAYIEDYHEDTYVN